jgi:hypothetical protein
MKEKIMAAGLKEDAGGSCSAPDMLRIQAKILEDRANKLKSFATVLEKALEHIPKGIPLDTMFQKSFYEELRR